MNVGNNNLTENGVGLTGLERLVIRNGELEELERLLDPFNIFEAMGVRRQELRHSQFLAYLMDPRESHGLGDRLTRHLLQASIVGANRPAPISPIHLDVWDLGQAEVRREWHGIDILVVDRLNKFVVIFENKIGAREANNQLERYWMEVELNFPGWTQLGFLLSPDGLTPTDDRYVPVAYEAVCSTLEWFVSVHGSTMGDEVRIAMRHYTQMLRRHVVENSPIIELCRQIYSKHKNALDLIFEHRPDLQSDVHDLLISLIQTDETLTLDVSNKQYIRFAPTEWDLAPMLKESDGWTETHRLLLFEFNNAADRLTLGLVLGPGPEKLRGEIFRWAAENKPFKPHSKSLNAKWNHLWTHEILGRRRYADSSIEDLKPPIEEAWREFRETSLPAFRDAVGANTHLWAHAAT